MACLPACLPAYQSMLAISCRPIGCCYRKVDLQPHELLTSVFIPFNCQYEYVKEFKQVPQPLVHHHCICQSVFHMSFDVVESFYGT